MSSSTILSMKKKIDSVKLLVDDNLILNGCGEDATDFVVVVEQLEGSFGDALDRIKNNPLWNETA